MLYNTAHTLPFLFFRYLSFFLPLCVCLSIGYAVKKNIHEKNSWAWLNYNIEKTYPPEQEREWREYDGCKHDLRNQKKKNVQNQHSLCQFYFMSIRWYLCSINFLSTADSDLCIYYYCDINLCLFLHKSKERIVIYGFSIRFDYIYFFLECLVGDELDIKRIYVIYFSMNYCDRLLYKI